MLIVLLVVLLASLWGLWNLYVQTLRFNELLASCEQTLQQLHSDLTPEGDDGERDQHSGGVSNVAVK